MTLKVSSPTSNLLLYISTITPPTSNVPTFLILAEIKSANNRILVQLFSQALLLNSDAAYIMFIRSKG